MDGCPNEYERFHCLSELTILEIQYVNDIINFLLDLYANLYFLQFSKCMW